MERKSVGGQLRKSVGEAGSPPSESPGSCRLKGLESRRVNIEQQALHTNLQNGDISPTLPFPQPGSARCEWNSSRDGVVGVGVGVGGTRANLETSETVTGLVLRWRFQHHR